ncbi:phosphoadenosine phosphosulfate reductase family protein [Burkholderia cenocepacia]|uniref:phosphoadenosine phosphosulfate reductase family protein n=1 Tax=Burkholderia cenocepacia TaxID=95486 RepID=UPI001BA248A7|nr:phosphoadenosine phosphosulfate reductase family protein [Burkholderia cenocepacia]MBR8043384.1 phosphoadenosine phosphosulfate reductase family protein [Burkholderia cenocepacia]MBR8324549.1 phosphoadenosine phosphosulfate reductase family protein [Burkholderia cenocepacia]
MIETPVHFAASAPSMRITPAHEVDDLLRSGAVCAVGVSGGKDSQACAIAVAKYLDAIGHTGPRVLVHSDLGRVEWKDSLPVCERLAAHLGWELITVRRGAGDMLARWEGRWAANLARYRDLSCVKVILPWSTPSMRFCTSELKSAPISSALRKRFRDLPIVNVTGIRREESSARSKMPVWKHDARLTRRTAAGVTWNSIIDLSIDDVFDIIRDAGLDLHEAYTQYGASRVSCAYCIMSSEADLAAAASCEDNHALYRLMVELEATSTFAFQGNRWLADVAPHLLPSELQHRVKEAKQRAVARQSAEAKLPKHLLYTAGWPITVPTLEEAYLIASVRRDVATALDIEVLFTTPSAVRDRYDELLAAKARQECSLAEPAAA